jgi:hypothetical protein
MIRTERDLPDGIARIRGIGRLIDKGARRPMQPANDIRYDPVLLSHRLPSLTFNHQLLPYVISD